MIAELVLPVFIIASVIIMIFNNSIVKLLFGNEYAASSMILIPLGIWFVLSIINNFLGIQILVASGHQKEYSNAFLISAVASIVLCLALGKNFNMLGIAGATLISELILTVLLVCRIKNLDRRGKTR